jgi:hypothetical protein
MAKFVFTYRGGSVPESPEQQEAVMQAWMGWFGSLGDAVVDGGNPFGPSMTRTGGGEPAEGAPSELTGYSIVEAADLKEAAEMAGGCPVLTGGGSVDVYEAMPM